MVMMMVVWMAFRWVASWVSIGVVRLGLVLFGLLWRCLGRRFWRLMLGVFRLGRRVGVLRFVR